MKIAIRMADPLHVRVSGWFEVWRWVAPDGLARGLSIRFWRFVIDAVPA